MGKNSKLVEVIFKGERRAVYRNRHEIEVQEGDYVLVEADRGQDMGKVCHVGELVRLKRGKGETKSVLRKADPVDIEKMESRKKREIDAFFVCKEKIEKFGLDMKLVDVEQQYDGSKITFYFTAAQRVDFRELVKDLASVYRTRIELRQIGARDEAKRIGGVGVCGRKQCCSAFLSEFEQISTQLAKDQQLSLNPTKISGNCSRLLCCLRYEEDLYQQCLAKFPTVGSVLEIEAKRGTLTFINVFTNKGQMQFEDGTYVWFSPEELSKGHIHEEGQ